MVTELTLDEKIEVAAEQIEQSEEVGCLTSKQLRLILTQFSKVITNEDKMSTKSVEVCSGCKKLVDAYKMIVIKDLKLKELKQT